MDFSTRTGSKEPSMAEEEFELFRGLINRELGVEIKGDKRMTFHTKLYHRLAVLGLSTYRDYYNLIVSQSSQEEFNSLISHITNNETYFQREMARVQVFIKLLADIKRSKQRTGQNKISILSAGCSSGEEVYTVNIAIMESGLFAWGWEVDFLGIDADKTALKKAEKAVYTKNSFRMVGDDGEFFRKYFDRKDGSFIMKKPYRSNVRFKQANIIKPDSFSDEGMFDVIFCRNVLIYMGDEAISRAAENFYNHLDDNGYLIIGSAESLLNKSELFVPEYRDACILYRKCVEVA